MIDPFNSRILNRLREWKDSRRAAEVDREVLMLKNKMVDIIGRRVALDASGRTREIRALMAMLPKHHAELLADALNLYFEHTDQDCGGDDRIDACLEWLDAVDEKAETEGSYYDQLRKENRP